MGVLRPKTKTIPNNEYIDENISTNAQCPSKAMKNINAMVLDNSTNIPSSATTPATSDITYRLSSGY
eukprot:scaffold8187_cov42-Cyclotella_meneghiniana.AAC.2